MVFFGFLIVSECLKGLFFAEWSWMLRCIWGAFGKAAANAATTSGMLLGSKVDELWHWPAVLRHLRLWNCEFGAKTCRAARLEMLLQRYRRFGRACCVRLEFWEESPALHCAFSNCPGLLLAKKSLMSKYKCMPQYSLSLQMFAKSWWLPNQLYSNQKALGNPWKSNESMLRFLPLNCAMQGQACKLQQIYTASRQQRNRFGWIWSSPQRFHQKSRNVTRGQCRETHRRSSSSRFAGPTFGQYLWSHFDCKTERSCHD